MVQHGAIVCNHWRFYVLFLVVIFQQTPMKNNNDKLIKIIKLHLKKIEYLHLQNKEYFEDY